MTNERLGQLHHVGIVGVGLVDLEEGVLGVVRRVDPLVAEDGGHLVDPLEASDDEPLEIQLRRNAEVKVALQLVVAGYEGTRRGPAVDRLEHRGLYVEEAPAFEERPHGGEDARPLLEERARLLVGDQMQIAPPPHRLHVPQSVEFLRHGLQGLGEQIEAAGLDGYLAGPRDEERAFDAEHVAAVDQLLELCEFLGLVQRQIDLNRAVLVFDAGKARFAHAPHRGQPAGEADRSGVAVGMVGRKRLGDGMAAAKLVRIGVDTQFPKALQLFDAGRSLVHRPVSRRRTA